MRGQVSIEAILVSGFAILVLVSLVNIAFERLDLSREVGEAGEIKMIGELLATTINNVYANGEGFSIYLGPDVLNYTKLQDVEKIWGVALALPIEINETDNTIVLRKDTTKTGGGNWTVTVPIIPANISINTDLTTYDETTILNNGTYIIIYANSGYFGKTT